MKTYPYLEHIIGTAKRLGPVRMAVVYPCSAVAVEAAASAQAMGLIEPVMIGPRERIEAIAVGLGIDPAAMAFVETGPEPDSAARAAVALCQSGETGAIMKGSLHTDELLAVVVGKDSGLRTRRRMSHAFVFDLPDYPQPLLMADCVVNIAPGLMEKRDIVQNAVGLAHALGIARPYVAVLSAVETINPAIPGTLDAAALSKMAERGQITGAVVDGPLSFDLAISALAAEVKGVVLRNAARPDILVVPNLEAGNMLYKQLVYLGGAECAGVILGIKVPVVLTSRADSVLSRIASCALAVVCAHSRPAVGAAA
jgi:phosphate acetyltransferase